MKKTILYKLNSLHSFFFNFFFVLILINVNIIKSQKIDSLKINLNENKSLIERLIVLGKLAENCEAKDIEMYCTQSLELISKINSTDREKNKRVIQIEEARVNNNLSYYFFKLSLYSKAEDFAIKSILSLEKSHLDTSLLISSYNNLASVYMAMASYDKAIDIFKKNLVFDLKVKNNKALSLDYNNISSAFRQKKNSDSAVYYAKKSIAIKEQLNAKEELITSYRLLGIIFLDINDMNSSKEYFDKALLLTIELNEESAFPLIYYWKGIGEKKTGNIDLSEDFFLKSLIYSKNAESISVLYNTHLELYDLYERKNDYKKSLYHYKQYKLYEDSVMSESLQKESEIKQIKFDYSKKEIELTDRQEKELAVSHEKQKRQRLIILFGVISISIIVLFLVFVLNRARVLTKQQRLIQQQSDKLQAQKGQLIETNKMLDKKNITITENINYAKNIQDSLMPSEEKVSVILKKKCFILFQPKDIVSGDFYWTSSKNDKQLFVLADCTGHGVTGAFISILAIKSLEKITGKYELDDLESIIKNLNDDFTKTFGDGSVNHFGIELALCCFDSQSNRLLMTGSSNSICVLKDDQLSNFQFSNLAIGSIDTSICEMKIIEKHIEPGSIIYFYTDGFCDQKGGDLNKKFLSKNLRSKFSEISHFEMHIQKEILMTTFNLWKRNNEQIDDISVVGIRVN